ncbi:protein of unknown function [Burkholderia multivorans]
MHRVRTDHARQLDFDDLLSARHHPAVTRRITRIKRGGVLQQFAWMLRCAMLAHVGRRGAEEPPHGEESALDQRIGNRRKDLKRDIEALLDRIDHAVVDDHVELDAGIALVEGGQWRAEVAQRETREHLDAQPAGRCRTQLPHLVGQLVDAPDDFGTFAVEGFANLGKPHMPRAAVKKRCVDELFQLLDAGGDNRARHAQLPGGLGEAACFRHSHEGLDTEKSIHASALSSYSVYQFGRGPALSDDCRDEAATNEAGPLFGGQAIRRNHRFEQKDNVRGSRCGIFRSLR